MKPVRDWRCLGCGTISPDVPTDVPDQYCPYCGEPMSKIYAAPTILFNGDGWTPKFHGGTKEN